MILFLTSSPTGAYRSTEAPAFKGLDPSNGMVRELKRYWEEDSACLLVSAFPEEYALNERMRGDFERILLETLQSASSMEEWKAGLDEKIGAVSGDDYTPDPGRRKNEPV